MPDFRERIIRLKVQSDFREASEGIDRLRARQELLHDSTKRQHNEIDRLEQARNARQTDYNNRLAAQDSVLGKLAVRARERISNIRGETDQSLAQRRVEAEMEGLRSLNAQKELKRQEDHRRSMEQTISSFNKLRQSSTIAPQDREQIIDLKVELDDKLAKERLRQLSSGKPRVTMEAVLDEGKAKAKIELLQRRKIQIKAEIDIQQSRTNYLKAAAASGLVDEKEVKRSQSALAGLKNTLGETESLLGDLVGGGSGGGGGGLLKKLGEAWGDAGENARGFGGTLLKIGPAIIPILVGIVGVVASLAGELLAAGAAAVAMAGAFVGAVAVVGVGLVLSFKRATEAMKLYSQAQQEAAAASEENLTAAQKYQKALAAMTPEAAKFTKYLTGTMMPAIASLQSVSETSFLPGLQSFLESTMKLAPQVTGLFKGVGDAVSKAFGNLGDFLTSGSGLDEVTKLFEGIQEVVDNLSPAFEQLGEAFATIFGEGASSAGTFAEKINEIATNFNNWIQGLASDGRLQAYFKKGEQYLEDFFSLIGSIGDLLGSAFGAFTEGDGPSFLDILSMIIDYVKDIIDFFNQSSLAVTGFKTLGVAVLGILAGAIAVVVVAFEAIAETIGAIVKTFQKLYDIGVWIYEHLGGDKSQQVTQISDATRKAQDAQAAYNISLREGGKLYNEMAAASTSASDSAKTLSAAHENSVAALRKYNTEVGKLKDSTLAASRADRDAREDLAKNRKQDAEALEQDKKDIAERKKAEQEARQNLKDTQRDNARSIQNAEDTAAAAHLKTLKAQDSLNKARKEALQDLIDLRKEVERGSLNEEKGALALRQAQQAYFRVMQDASSTYEQREAARLDVAEKQSDLSDTVDTNRANRANLKTAEGKGVEGSDKVKDAIQNRIDAEKDEKKAVQDVTIARQNAAKSEKKAQEEITKAVDDTHKAEKKLRDDKAQFAIDERNALEKSQEAHKKYIQAIKDEQTQIDILKAKKQEAFDDEKIKADAFKKNIMSQSFAGYDSANVNKGESGKNKTLTSKEADEYIKLYNGLDPAIRTALDNVGLPNNLDSMKKMVSAIAAAKKASPKASAASLVGTALQRQFSTEPNRPAGFIGPVVATPDKNEYIYDSKSKRYVKNPAFKAPLKPTDAAGAGTTSSQSIYTDPKTGKPQTIASLLGASAKDTKKAGTDATKAFGEGINAGITQIKPDIAGELSRSITGSGGAIPKTVTDDLEIKSPSKVAFRAGGAFGQGLADGLSNSVATIQGIMDAYYTGTGKTSIKGILFNSFELSGGRSQWFFKVAGAMMVGIRDGIINSVSTIQAAIKVMTDAIFKGFQGPLDVVGDLFSAMMDEGYYSMSVGSNNVLQAMRLFLAELNKISTSFGVIVDTTLVKDIPVPKLRTPANIGAKARGGFAGGPDQGDYQRYDSGGKIQGTGGGTEDKVTVRVSPREWIQPEHSVNYYGDNIMEGIRTRRIPREALQGFATGGAVTRATQLYAPTGKLTDDQIDYLYGGDERKKKAADSGSDSLSGFAKGGLASLGELLSFATGGQVINQVKSWLTGTADKLPYVLGSNGPKAYDCSSLVGEVWAQLTNHARNKRYFSTANEGDFLSNHGFKKGNNAGKATFVVGYTNSGSTHHTVGRLDGINFAARSSKLGISAPHTDRPERYQNVYYLPSIDAMKGSPSAPSAAPVTATPVADSGSKNYQVSFAKMQKLKLSDFTKANSTFGAVGRVYGSLLAAMQKAGKSENYINRLVNAIGRKMQSAAGSGNEYNANAPDEAILAPGVGDDIATIAPKNPKIRNNMRFAVLAARNAKATYKQLLAMFETGIVESHFTNYANKNVKPSLAFPGAEGKPQSDHTSVGIYQQQVGKDGSGKGFSWGNYKQAMDPYQASLSFLSHAAKVKNQAGLSAGQLAQKTQISAFPDRYQQNRANAIAMLTQMGYTAANFKGFAEGGSPGYAFMPPSAFAAGGNVGQADLPNRSLGRAAQAIGSSSVAGGFHVDNLNVNNPMQERAGDSIYRQVEKMKTIYG